MADADRKRELIAELDRARSRAGVYRRELTHDAQVGPRLKEGLKEGFNQHRGIFLGAAALIGLLISKIPPRTKKVEVKVGGRARVKQEAKAVGALGLLFGVAKFLIDLFRPMLIKWGTRRLAQYMGNGSATYRPQ